MSYYTRDFDTFKAAFQGALPYSEDLTAATLTTVTAMGADYSALDDPEWYQSFLSIFQLECLTVVPAALWGVTVSSAKVVILKREQSIIVFQKLSTNQWRVTLPDLGLSDWTKHP